MSLQHIAGFRIGEDSDDLRNWLLGLEDCPQVNVTLLASCDNEVHGDDPPTWFFVEGDAGGAIARRRCLACGRVKHLLDSEDHWTHPPMKSCGSCGQSMFEMGVGMHVERGTEVGWVVVGLRCVGCGCLDGLTDFTVPQRSVDEVRAQI